MHVSICIATFRRTERLRALLQDLANQQLPPYEVVVVDNDAAGSAREVAEWAQRRFTDLPIRYDIQPVQNIALTRNRTVEIARGDWLAFVDDDERAPPAWLLGLASAARAYAADGVLGPVVPVVASTAPAWIRRGTFYEWPRLPSGSAVPRNQLRFGNVLLRASLLRHAQPPFDPAYGLTGGEDGDLLSRLANAGASIVWCDTAIVHEPIEPSRLSLRWLLRRSLRGGQDFARHTLAGRYGPVTALTRVGFATRAVLQSIAALGLAGVSWPRGRHRTAHWLLKAAANAGKLSVFWGYHYREYAASAAAASSSHQRNASA
jgi:succinoglycan biosynthesis protein ExoM